MLHKHICELLFEHDCVIVPDFGGFVCNTMPARLQQGVHRFHPPFKKISFNRNLSNNDGLLAHHISVAEGITYSEAVSQISLQVEEMKKTLFDKSRFTLPDIGLFRLGNENTILFEQDETVNYLPAALGLTAFSFPTIHREAVERKIERKLKDKVIVPSKEGVHQSPSRRKVLRPLLAAAAVLVLAVSIWLPIQYGSMGQFDYSSLNPFAPEPMPLYQLSATDKTQPDPDGDVTKPDVKNLIAMAAKDTVRYLNIVIDGDIPIVVKLKDDVSPGPSKTRSKKSVTRSGNKFHIVGGAFSVPENAEKLLNKLIKAGYNALIIDKKGNQLRFVSYGSFSTREEALQALDKIRAVQQDAWLMMN